jgi:gliding motility-associated-like protein
MKAIVLSILLFLATAASLHAQCTAPGQTPATAFPVCGTSVFQQNSVPVCSSHQLYVPGCSGTTSSSYEDKNPFWYRFTCYQTGTLGFLIKPLAANEDYDWQLYDITGHDPNDVFTVNSLVVTANWAGTFGNTGASASGVAGIQCGSDPSDGFSTFAAMPTILVGHTYLLLISHFSDSQSGYNLSFGGGTGIITDPNVPRLKTAEANCGGDVIRLKLSKNIFCNSISGDGSEFYITPATATAVSATGVLCTTNFDTDSLQIRLSAFLDPGNYILHIKKGSDGNTLLDYCNNAVPETDAIPFVLLPKFPTPMDSLVSVACAPNQLRLVFKKLMACATVAADGSDFVVNGTYPVTVSGASGVTCTPDGLSKEIVVTLSAPLERAGSFNIVLRSGSDGNTILNECGEPTAPGASLPFSVKDTVNADFTYAIGYGCATDTVRYFHPSANGVNSWRWTLDDNQQSTAQNPVGLYPVFIRKTATLVVSNGFCMDSTSRDVELINFLKAGFSVLKDNCPTELVPFHDESIGQGLTYDWSFGDGAISDSASPHHAYLSPPRERLYTVRLTITDSFECQKSVEQQIIVYSSCLIAVPNAFTPNNDGRNDRFRVLNAVKAEDFELMVFNRWGQLVFRTRNWKEGWDGRIGNKEQGTAVYVWDLRYTDRDTKRKIEQKGTMVLIR